MSQLTYKQREKLPSSDFVFPKDRRYPIQDIEHARNALARVSQFGSPEEQAKVRAAVYSRYPELKESSDVKEKVKKKIKL